MVCPVSYHLLAGESPVVVTVRRPRSRHPVLQTVLRSGVPKWCIPRWTGSKTAACNIKWNLQRRNVNPERGPRGSRACHPRAKANGRALNLERSPKNPPAYGELDAVIVSDGTRGGLTRSAAHICRNCRYKLMKWSPEGRWVRSRRRP